MVASSPRASICRCSTASVVTGRAASMQERVTAERGIQRREALGAATRRDTQPRRGVGLASGSRRAIEPAARRGRHRASDAAVVQIAIDQHRAVRAERRGRRAALRRAPARGRPARSRGRASRRRLVYFHSSSRAPGKPISRKSREGLRALRGERAVVRRRAVERLAPALHGIGCAAGVHATRASRRTQS